MHDVHRDILQFGIRRVVIGEARNFAGNIEFLSERGVEAVLMHDEDCIELMSRFIEERPGPVVRGHRGQRMRRPLRFAAETDFRFTVPAHNAAAIVSKNPAGNERGRQPEPYFVP